MDQIWWLDDWTRWKPSWCWESGSPWMFGLKLGGFLTAHSCQEHRAAIEGSCYWRDTPNNSVFVTEFLKQSTAGGFSYAKIHQPMKFPSNQLISPWDHHHVPRHGPWLPWLVGFPSQMNGSFPMLTWFEIVRSLMNHFISNHESSSSWWKKPGFLCSMGRKSGAQLPQFRRRGPEVPWSWCHGSMMGIWQMAAGHLCHRLC